MHVENVCFTSDYKENTNTNHNNVASYINESKIYYKGKKQELPGNTHSLLVEM